MLKTLYRILPWTILSLSFVIPAFYYHAIPDEVLITRNLDGSNPTFAPKSLFAVFRVPLIELVCASAIELMRRRFTDSNSEKHQNYYSMWSILLYTVAFKSLFQTFEIVSSKQFTSLFFYLTFGVVIAGIILALFKGRKVFSAFNHEDWNFGRAEKLALAILFAVYLGLAFVPMSMFG
ncbi:MAG: hypothetical protein M3R14_08430 [Acidobacteriota bacterium]|nr:hypothetical protein [Acidobacteriota bacterium]